MGNQSQKNPISQKLFLSICKDKRVTLSRKVCNGNKNHLEYKTVEELQKECLNKPMPKKRKSSIKKSTKTHPTLVVNAVVPITVFDKKPRTKKTKRRSLFFI